MLIALFLTFGWQSFGRNMFADETRGGERTHLYGTQGPIASLPPSVACASTEGERDWPLSTMAFTVPLQGLLENVAGMDATQRDLITDHMGCVPLLVEAVFLRLLRLGGLLLSCGLFFC